MSSAGVKPGRTRRSRRTPVSNHSRPVRANACRNDIPIVALDNAGWFHLLHSVGIPYKHIGIFLALLRRSNGLLAARSADALLERLAGLRADNGGGTSHGSCC